MTGSQANRSARSPTSTVRSSPQLINCSSAHTAVSSPNSISTQSSRSAPFGGSRGYIQQVLGTSDGTLIATSGGDRSVTLYDVAEGVRLGTPLIIADNASNLIALSADGRRLAIPSSDGVQIWDLEPKHWADAACQVAGRNLTREEWDTHIGDLAAYRATCPDFPQDR